MAAARVFIDGEAGTTGLQIRERLLARDDIALISLDDAQRKDTSARRDALHAADVAILCLPDDAAREAAALAKGASVKLIDASTAHRTAEGWVFGFPEFRPSQREAVIAADRVSNPGCYSTGAIATLAPLVSAGVVPADYPVTIGGVSGYTGGGKKDPSYKEVSRGTTGHAEAVEVTFDPGRVSYEQLLEVFWRNIDPLQSDGQFCDRGDQYKTAVFTDDKGERKAYDASRKRVEAFFGEKVATKLLPDATFWVAEAYHQNYFRQNPMQGYCAYIVAPKVAKFRKTYSDRLNH